MQWLAGLIRLGHLCDGCGERWAMHRAHLRAKGSAGDDLWNVVLLCALCHALQEKRAEAFCAELGVDLFAKAAGHTERFLAEAA